MTKERTCRSGRVFSVTLLLIFLFTLSLSTSSLFALNTEINRATLRGLKGVRVLIEDLPPEAEQAGLTKNQLQNDVESKLQGAGIKTLSQEECFKTPGEPYFYINVNVNATKNEGELYAYSIDIGLVQNVILERDPKQTGYAVTWSTGGLGLLGKKQLNQIRDSVEDMVLIFVKAFLSVNPRK